MAKEPNKSKSVDDQAGSSPVDVGNVSGAVAPGAADVDQKQSGVTRAADPKPEPDKKTKASKVIREPGAEALVDAAPSVPTLDKPAKEIATHRYDVFTRGKKLATVEEAIDESEAISKVVAEFKITKPEKFQFVAKRID